MLIDDSVYQSKGQSVIKKTLLVSLAVHLLLAGILLFIPGDNAPAADTPEPVKRRITLVAAAHGKPRMVTRPAAPTPTAQTTSKRTQQPVQQQKTATKPETQAPPTGQDKPSDTVPPAPDGGGEGLGVSAAISGRGASSSADDSAEGHDIRTQAEPFDLDGLRARFIRSLEKNKEYPYMARRRMQTGTVALSITLDSSGGLQSVNIRRASGFSQLDEAAAALVRKICPFAHQAGRAVTMDISINYDLKD